VDQAQPNKTTRAILRVLREALRTSNGGSTARYRILLERCIELDDGSDREANGDPTMPPFRLRPYLLLAVDLLDESNPEAALGPLEQAVVHWPDQCDVHILLGRCHAARNDWDSAVDAYHRCVEIERRPYICVLLAHALDKLHRRIEAEWWLRHSLVIDPDYEESHFNLGCIDAQRGDFAAAEQRFRRALELDPDYAVAHYKLGDLLLTRTAGSASRIDHPDWPAALHHLSRAAELTPGDHNLRGLVDEMDKLARRTRARSPLRDPST
jgi:tetratricopeptide (TPR) repeat protein